MSLLKLVLVVLLAAYLGLAAFAYLFANRLVFPAPPPGYRDAEDTLKHTCPITGDRITLLHLPQPDAAYLVFYHHGNGEDLMGIRERLQVLHEAGFAVLAWDYPGYGTSEGRATEKRVLELAGQLWETIPEQFGYAHDRVILYGRSVGGGPATWLASRGNPAGLILEGTFTSIFRVGLPFNPLPWDLFDNLSRIRQIRCPVLFLHGTADRTVPFSHGKALHEAAPSPKFFSWFDGGGHNDLVEAYRENYDSSILRFRRFLDQARR